MGKHFNQDEQYMQVPPPPPARPQLSQIAKQILNYVVGCALIAAVFFGWVSYNDRAIRVAELQLDAITYQTCAQGGVVEGTTNCISAPPQGKQGQ